MSSSRFGEPTARDRLLLRAAVTSGPPARAAWEEWFSGVVLDDVPYDEVRLLPQVFANLGANGAVECLPPRVRGNYRWVWTSNQQRCHAVAPALQSLVDAGIPTLLLKGAALLASGQCDWGAREMGDVDVLVPARRVADAASVLDAAGWLAQSGVTPDFLARRLALRRHSWNYEREAPHGNLDLHWHAFEGQRTADVAARLWGRARRVCFGGVELVCLDDLDQLLHTIEHASHGEPSHRLLWIADTARALDTIDGAELARRARQLGVHGLVNKALGVVADALGTPSAQSVAARVARCRAGSRERVLVFTETGTILGRCFPRLSEHLRAILVQGVKARRPANGMGVLIRRRIEPSLCARPALSTGLALAGRPRRVEVAVLRWLGPLARPPTRGVLAPGEWVDLTNASGIDRVAGAGWSWPLPEGAWTDGAESRLALDVAIPRGRPLALEFRFGAEAHMSPNPRVVVLVNGRPVVEWTFGAGPEPTAPRLEIPAWLADWCRPIDVVFRARRTFEPRSRDRGPGDIRRAAQLRAVRVIETPE